jgi:hypothetical protein
MNESRLWFPGLAQYLVADLASRVQQRRTLVDHYGTHRWLTGNSSASIDDMGAVRLGQYSATIERLPVSIVTSFSDLTFADNKYSQATAQVQTAAEIFDGVDTLADTVGCLVRSIHLLWAPRDHDVSHSSPQLPFSIFVSIPEPTERHANLRVAESVIHESMHLQLSLLGTVEPLLGTSDSCGYSPWKRELRPVEGLLHGIYVFAVIHQVLGILAETQPSSQAYCIKRRNEIQTEVSILPEQANGLSATGNTLWQKSRRSVLAG